MDQIQQLKIRIFGTVALAIYQNRDALNWRLKIGLIKQIITIISTYMDTLMCMSRHEYHNDSKYHLLRHDYILSKKYSAYVFVEDLIYLYDHSPVVISSEENFVDYAAFVLRGHDLFQTVNDSFDIIRCLSESTLFDQAKFTKIYVDENDRDSEWSKMSAFLTELEKLSLTDSKGMGRENLQANIFSFKYRFNDEEDGRLDYVGERWYPMLSGNIDELNSLVSGNSKTQCDTSYSELFRFIRDKTVHASEKLRSNKPSDRIFRELFKLSNINNSRVEEWNIYTELKIALLKTFPMVPSAIYRVRSFFPKDQTLSRPLRSKYPVFEMRKKTGCDNAKKLTDRIGLVEEIAYHAREKGEALNRQVERDRTPTTSF